MKTKLICVVILFSMGIIACKKESTTQTKTTQEKILGKWNLQSTAMNDYYNGTSHPDTIYFLPGEYIEFRADGKAYGYNSGSFDTSVYGITNDSKIWIDDPGYIFDILTLTDADLKIYRKEIYSATEYSEATVKAKR